MSQNKVLCPLIYRYTSLSNTKSTIKKKQKKKIKKSKRKKTWMEIYRHVTVTKGSNCVFEYHGFSFPSVKYKIFSDYLRYHRHIVLSSTRSFIHFIKRREFEERQIWCSHNLKFVSLFCPCWHYIWIIYRYLCIQFITTKCKTKPADLRKMHLFILFSFA